MEKEILKNWLSVGGFENITHRPNPKVMKILTKLAIQNLLHPFQTFILGQKNLAPYLAAKHNIKLVFYGENEAEYGNPLADNSKALRDRSFFTMNNLKNVYLSGIKVKDLISRYNLKLSDLKIYLPLEAKAYKESRIQIHYLGYYLKWIPKRLIITLWQTLVSELGPTGLKELIVSIIASMIKLMIYITIQDS